MYSPFLLPDYITHIDDSELINNVHEQLNKLAFQKLVQQFLNVFEKVPNLESFRYAFYDDSDDEGNYHYTIDILNADAINENKTSPHDELNFYLNYLKHQESGHDIFAELAEQDITQDNIHALMETVFPVGEFKKWQEAKKAFEEKSQLDKVVKTVEHIPQSVKL